MIRHKKDNLFVIFDDITWNCEDKACRLHVYMYDANFLLPRFRLQLVQLSKDVTLKKYAIDVNDSCGLSSECQFRAITVHCIKGWFDIIDSMYEFDKKFPYISTAGGFIINRHMDCKEDGVNYMDTTYLSFSFFMSMFCQVFNRLPMLFPNGERQVESTVAFGSVGYDL